MKPEKLEELVQRVGLDPDRVFSAPWEARAFAIALGLAEAGAFSWDEFRERLIEEVAESDRARQRGESTTDCYYDHFLRALERLLEAKGLANAADVERKLRDLEAPTG